MNEVVTAGRRKIRISHTDRVLFGEARLTKLDLARYFADVAAAMVPHVRERPLALHSFPQGVDGEGYFVKDVPRHFPAWVTTSAVPKREGGTIHQALAHNAATLVYLAGQNVAAPHVWTARADRLERPDRLVFDLDPSTEFAGSSRRRPAAQERELRRRPPVLPGRRAQRRDRLSERGDPWRRISAHAKGLSPARRALERITGAPGIS